MHEKQQLSFGLHLSDPATPSMFSEPDVDTPIASVQVAVGLRVQSDVPEVFDRLAELFHEAAEHLRAVAIDTAEAAATSTDGN